MKAGIFFLTAVLIYACTLRDPAPAASVPTDPYARAKGMINEALPQMYNGDLVVRSGMELSSQYIRNFNRHDRTYSHSGIVFIEGGYPYVYHILPGTENPGERLRKDSLIRFCNPRNNSGFALYRYDLDSSEQEKLQKDIYKWYAKGILFDSSFNMASNDRMYCSEMIKKGLEDATNKRIIIQTTRPTMEEARFFAPHLKCSPAYLAGLDIVTIDNLFLNPHCRQVARYNFNQ